MGRILLAIITILLLATFSGPIGDGIDTWRSDTVTDNAVVATGAGVVTGTVTLSRDLFLDAPGKVITITSTISETPAATSYVAATKVLTVSALTANTSRTLTVTYHADTTEPVMLAIGPFLSLFIFGGIIGLTLVFAFKGKGR